MMRVTRNERRLLAKAARDTRDPRYFQNVLRALIMAAPWSLSRFVSLQHCIEASYDGAAALRTYKGVTAKAVPCALVGLNMKDQASLSIGLSRREVYDRLDPAGEIPPFEAWEATKATGLPEGPHPSHMVIEAQYLGERARVDLTLGQLGELGVPAPLSALALGPHAAPLGDSPVSLITVGDWDIGYIASPHAEAILASARSYSAPNAAADLVALMDLALSCSLIPDRFHGQLQRQVPDVFAAGVAWAAQLIDKAPALAG